jgi:hypothetical protein
MTMSWANLRHSIIGENDYHFKELNPDATPANYNRMQQQMDDFDAWGIP